MEMFFFSRLNPIVVMATDRRRGPWRNRRSAGGAILQFASFGARVRDAGVILLGDD